ncbi:MAG: DinB family protein [Tepidiformaceae bacterium]
MNRIEIETKLNRDRAWLLETLGTMDPAELTRPATPSEHDPTTTWTMLDHVAHLSLIEGNFNAMVRRFIAGDANPVGLRTKADGSERPMPEIMTMVHTMTEEWKRKHADKALAEVVALGQASRAQTLALLAELSDEQLTQTLPGAPWADGTIGGVLAVNADHGRMHYNWAKEGLAGK